MTPMEKVLALSLKKRRDLLIKTMHYQSGEGLLNTVYMGGLATASLYRVFGLKYGGGGIKKAIKKADGRIIDEALTGPARHTLLYMLAHPVEKCPHCGQIMSST